ncbi:MAG: hypothetical protein L3K03_01635 [Thermoplasmata archaeon]|nr:hypothetical protein [Thermoplasmata archaeon]
MVTQRRYLRLLSCTTCDHLRGSHYIFAVPDGRIRRHFTRPRDRTTPMPCHVVGCECRQFLSDVAMVPCPLCSRKYATRASLEIHLYGQHPGLTLRERSSLLQQALRGPAPWATTPATRELPSGGTAPVETAEV